MKYTLKAIIIFSLLLFSCGDESNEPGVSSDFERLDYFYDNASSMQLEVAYEVGAEPYINDGFGGANNFEFTKNNIANLFSGRSSNIAVLCDEQLNEMTQIPAQNKANYTPQEILTLSDQFQIAQSTANQGVIFLVYLDGYLNLNGQEEQNVLGISVGSFVVAIFKPVITNIPAGGILGGNPRYFAEQATVVHELGHALGLVNNDVDMTVDHQDEAHGKHCSNTDCVMFWEITSTSGASGMFGNSASVTDLVFGQECINDISAFRE